MEINVTSDDVAKLQLYVSRPDSLTASVAGLFLYWIYVQSSRFQMLSKQGRLMTL